MGGNQLRCCKFAAVRCSGSIESISRALRVVSKARSSAVLHHERRTFMQLITTRLYTRNCRTLLPKAMHVITELSTFIGRRWSHSGRNPTRPFVSESRSRPARRVSRRSETGVVSIGALHTHIHVDRWTDRRKWAFPSVRVL